MSHKSWRKTNFMGQPTFPPLAKLSFWSRNMKNKVRQSLHMKIKEWTSASSWTRHLEYTEFFFPCRIVFLKMRPKLWQLIYYLLFDYALFSLATCLCGLQFTDTINWNGSSGAITICCVSAAENTSICHVSRFVKLTVDVSKSGLGTVLMQCNAAIACAT